LAITIGLVGGFGAAPVAGLIGFAHGWTRWSELTVLDRALADSTGFLVVAADLPARTLSTVRDIPPPFRTARPGRTHR
jgi:hypothetical protein